MKNKLLIVFILLLTVNVFALSIFGLWNSLIGYTVDDVKEIDGWVDEDGEKGDFFEGCEWKRKIVFTDDTYLTCKGYRYHYSYKSEAIIFVNSYNIKMLVDGDIYDMERND